MEGPMRGRDDRSEGLFSYVRLEDRVPADHPLRAIRALADEALALLSERFEALYSRTGRPSIPPEMRSEEHTSELQSRRELVCRLLLEKKKKKKKRIISDKKKKKKKKQTK